MKPNLISFDLCPFVQRSVITLLEKGVDFDITYIDLAEPPAWFLKISPFGKVPALQVGEVTLFESAVINEYLDEINPPSLHPADPLQKALNRAWIEFGSELIGSQYLLSIADTEDHYDKHHADVLKKFGQLENLLDGGPFFNGQDFCLIDAAFAPAFMRFAILERRHELELWEDHPKVRTWSDALLDRSSVTQSVIAEFEEKYLDYIRNTGGHAAGLFG